MFRNTGTSLTLSFYLYMNTVKSNIVSTHNKPATTTKTRMNTSTKLHQWDGMYVL